MVKAKVIKDRQGRSRILAQRAKHKHWFLLGQNTDTDRAFTRALTRNEVGWLPTVSVPSVSPDKEGKRVNK